MWRFLSGLVVVAVMEGAAVAQTAQTTQPGELPPGSTSIENQARQSVSSTGAVGLGPYSGQVGATRPLVGAPGTGTTGVTPNTVGAPYGTAPSAVSTPVGGAINVPQPTIGGLGASQGAAYPGTTLGAGTGLGNVGVSGGGAMGGGLGAGLQSGIGVGTAIGGDTSGAIGAAGQGTTTVTPGAGSLAPNVMGGAQRVESLTGVQAGTSGVDSVTGAPPGALPEVSTPTTPPSP